MPLIDIVIPAEAGEIEECVVVTWLKKEGDEVQPGEEILILQAEKVSFEVPAPAGGTLRAALAKQGEVVKRGQPLARLEVSAEAGVAPPPAAPQPEPVAPPPPPATDVRASPVAKRLAREHGLDLAQIPTTGDRVTEKDVLAFIEARQAKVEAAAPPAEVREVRASPSAKRLAREHGLDLSQIPSTGGSDRITERDVEAYLAAQQQPAPAEPTPPDTGQTIPLAGMRAAIAQRMHQSLQQMAQLTLHTEADVTELVAFREQRKTDGITYTDLIIRACALALRQHPRLNATLVGNEIRLLPEIDIGLAVALDDGLVVPVIRRLSQKSLADIAGERAALAERARAGQLKADEMSGSTLP